MKITLTGLIAVASLMAATETHLKWNFRNVQLSAGSTVQVNIPSGVEYVFGARSTSAANPVFVVGEAMFAAGKTGGATRMLNQLDNLPANLINTSGSQLEVVGTSVPGSAVIIYGSIPENTVVELYCNEVLVSRGTIAHEGSMLVQNGSMIASPVKGVSTLLTKFTSSMIEPPVKVVSPLLTKVTSPTADTRQLPPPRLRPLSNGRQFANIGVLGKNLSTYVRPAISPSAVGCCVSVVRVRVIIDTGGTVIDVKNVGLDSPVFSTIDLAVRAWKFTPFVSAEGGPVTVEGIIPFFITKSGGVASPVLDASTQ